MWKDEYHKLYFHEIFDFKASAKASILKEENAPNTLFKYIKAEYAILSLKDDFIKVSNPFDVNDPFEGEILFDYEGLSEEYGDDLLISVLNTPDFKLSDEDKSKIINSENPLNSLITIIYYNDSYLGEGLTLDEFKIDFTNLFSEFERYTVKNFNNEVKKQIIFVSLSEHNNIVPMWAHYADNHTGVCIEYNLLDFELGFEETCHPILYVNHADFTEEINYLNDDNRNKLKILQEPFLKKSRDWSYEDEWRILINVDRIRMASKIIDYSKFFDKRKDLCFIRFPKPTSVFLGLKISEKDEKEIINICQKREIKVYKMVKDESRYNLSYVEI